MKKNRLIWIQLCLIKLGKLLNVLMGVTCRMQMGVSIKSIGMMVLLKTTGQNLWAQVISRNKVMITLVLTYCSTKHNSSITFLSILI